MNSGFGRIAAIVLLLTAPVFLPQPCRSQAPYPPRAPVAPDVAAPQPAQPRRPQPPPRRPQPGPEAQPQPQGQQPTEYAFRPDLTNPEFGECLQLEKNWKNLYNKYYQIYSYARTMNPEDPQYAQTAYYVQHLKSQLDMAWNTFSSKCVYFPRR